MKKKNKLTIIFIPVLILVVSICIMDNYFSEDTEPYYEEEPFYPELIDHLRRS